MGLVLEVPLAGGTPDSHQSYDGHHRDQSRKEVGELGAEEIRDQKLREGERYAADSDHRQHLDHPPETGHYRNEHAGDDEGEKWRLAPRHQGAGYGDRRAEAGRRFKERTEDEGNEDHLDPTVVAHTS